MFLDGLIGFRCLVKEAPRCRAPASWPLKLRLSRTSAAPVRHGGGIGQPPSKLVRLGLIGCRIQGKKA